MRNIFLGLIVLVFTILYGCKEEEFKPIKVLILSGSNNHEWKKTTPVIEDILNDAGLFIASVTEKPDTLDYDDYKKYDVVVSNWNSWPDNDMRWSGDKEKDFTRYINDGGGFVAIHAGASSFYGWEDYHKIGIGRWGKKTSHGRQTIGKVNGFNQSHPITKGLSHFYIYDEFWENADIDPSAKPIGKVSTRDVKDGHPVNENVVFVNRTGKGRSFFTLLGHNERALYNTGLRTLIVRGTEWAARGVVTTKIPPELRLPDIVKPRNYSWEQSDSTFTLLNNGEIVWRYNFNNRYKKPYFHPVVIENSTLTCVAPSDHPWHLGLWFSWKYINKVNYWEYLKDYKTDETGYKSEGVTEIKDIRTGKNDDFSANISLDINYHPEGGKTVLKEKRNIYISAPGRDGSYFFDYEHTFTAVADLVELDRTPLPGEPGGQPHGGYAGLSVRYNQDFSSAYFIGQEEQNNYHGTNGDWLYMRMRTLAGNKAGICFVQYPEYKPESAGWFIVDDQEIPFHYFSPSPVFHKKIVLKKDETLILKYRALVLHGEIEKEDIEKKLENILSKPAEEEPDKKLPEKVKNTKIQTKLPENAKEEH